VRWSPQSKEEVSSQIEAQGLQGQPGPQPFYRSLQTPRFSCQGSPQVQEKVQEKVSQAQVQEKVPQAQGLQGQPGPQPINRSLQTPRVSCQGSPQKKVQEKVPQAQVQEKEWTSRWWLRECPPCRGWPRLALIKSNLH